MSAYSSWLQGSIIAAAPYANHKDAAVAYSLYQIRTFQAARSTAWGKKDHAALRQNTHPHVKRISI
jgi:hypothetical protein